MSLAWLRLLRNRILIVGSFLVIAASAATGWWLWGPAMHLAASEPAKSSPPATTQVVHVPQSPSNQRIELPRESWAAADIQIESARRARISQTVELTGKIALDEDRLAHIFPLVEGRVEEVKVRFGDRVKKGDLLVIVQSKEVGQSMLELYQHRLERDFAETKDRWTQEVAVNTQIMIELIRQGAAIEDVEKQLHNRPMGEYRDKLMTAYIGMSKSRTQLERLQPLSQGGVVSGRLLLDAETERDASRATLQSLLEQISQDARQAAILSTQGVKESRTRVAVDETNLKILGFDDEALAAVDPARQGESISHYPVYSPFDGTIISKDVVLLERVGPESQILSIADLSSVWLSTDIYEEHLPLLRQLQGKTLRFRCPAWPERSFEAAVFYTGDVVHESSRTISMRAAVNNQDGLLKPGMFVNVELPLDDPTHVLQVPLAAIIEHEGKSFVFVHDKDGLFERRDVTTGRRTDESIEILTGLEAGEQVVTRGGFALKSRMLAELLSE
jgi:cobalt-zinc-cadmium efflux system membrane fusion protein